MDIRELTLEEWGELLPENGFEVFHLPEALAVVDRYTEARLRLLGGFRGEEPVGLFPLFVRDLRPLRIVTSPPPSLSVPRLGPVLMPSSPKRRKQMALNQEFTVNVLRAVEADSHGTLFGVVGSSRYDDPRPYVWEGYSVEPRFSFALDLAGRGQDEVLDSFTRDLRSEVRKRDEIDVSLERAGPTDAERVCADLKERHAEQGLTYPTPIPYAGELVDALDERARVYVARAPDGRPISGITVLYSNDEAMFWQGGTKADYQGVSVNSLLHWKIITDVLTDSALDGIERYDLGSANNQRIGRYKSKFGADLVSNYEIKSLLMRFAKGAYSIRRNLTARRLRRIAASSLESQSHGSQ